MKNLPENTSSSVVKNLYKIKWLREIFYFVSLARPTNLILAALTFSLSAFISGLKTFDFVYNLYFWQECMLMLLIMAGGYWINDIVDYKIDRINKPQRVQVGTKLSVKKVLTGYIVTVGIVCLGSLNLPIKFILLNYAVAILLYFYATYLKRATVLGNLIIAFLSSAVIFCGALFYHIKMAHLWAIIFSFGISYIREVTKDIEDIKGDLHYRLRTLPILLGIRTTRYILLIAYGLLLISVNLPALVFYLQGNEVQGLRYWYFSFMLTQVPLLFCVQLLKTARLPREYHKQSLMLKVVMLAGLITILVL